MKTVFLKLLLGICVAGISGFTSMGETDKIDDDEKILLERERGGLRSITTTTIEAVLSSDLLRVNIENYTGELWVEVSGDGGSMNQSTQITNDGQVLLDISSLQDGSYVLRIGLGDAIYRGYFNISSR